MHLCLWIMNGQSIENCLSRSDEQWHGFFHKENSNLKHIQYLSPMDTHIHTIYNVTYEFRLFKEKIALIYFHPNTNAIEQLFELKSLKIMLSFLMSSSLGQYFLFEF